MSSVDDTHAYTKYNTNSGKAFQFVEMSVSAQTVLYIF